MHTAPAKVKYVSTIVNCNLSLVFKNTQLTPVYSRNIYCWATLKERQFHGDRNGACAIAICSTSRGRTRSHRNLYSTSRGRTRRRWPAPPVIFSTRVVLRYTVFPITTCRKNISKSETLWACKLASAGRILLKQLSFGSQKAGETENNLKKRWYLNLCFYPLIQCKDGQLHVANTVTESNCV